MNEQCNRMILRVHNDTGHKMIKSVRLVDDEAFDGGHSLRIELNSNHLIPFDEISSSNTPRVDLLGFNRSVFDQDSFDLCCVVMLKRSTSLLPVLIWNSVCRFILLRCYHCSLIALLFLQRLIRSSANRGTQGEFEEFVFQLGQSGFSTDESILSIAFTNGSVVDTTDTNNVAHIGALLLFDSKQARQQVKDPFVGSVSVSKSFNPSSTYVGGTNTYDIALQWQCQQDQLDSNEIRHFDIWLDTDNGRRFLGRTFSSEYLLQALTQTDIQQFQLEIIAYDILLRKIGSRTIKLE